MRRASGHPGGTPLTIDAEWFALLNDLLASGAARSPRGLATRDLSSRTVVVDARRPVLLNPARKLSYRFMAAEAYWILSGSDRVDEIAPWGEPIRAFSDDGVTFFGAYGPKFIEALPYVLAKLAADPDTRQAGFTLWRLNPPKTLDTPCTIALFFRRRKRLTREASIWEGTEEEVLDVHAFMRSSDVWLGLPYDVFNFSAIGWRVAAELNAATNAVLSPGVLYLTAASSHLYETNFAAARVAAATLPDREAAMVPSAFWSDPGEMMDLLKALRDTKKGDPLRWWER